jgi:hypothetical protein
MRGASCDRLTMDSSKAKGRHIGFSSLFGFTPTRRRPNHPWVADPLSPLAAQTNITAPGQPPFRFRYVDGRRPADCLRPSSVLPPHRLLNLRYSSVELSATSQQYFSRRRSQPPAINQQYFSIRTNQHQPPGKRTGCYLLRCLILGWIVAVRFRHAVNNSC